MKIPEPQLAPDVSIWVDHINPAEWVDGGCTSAVVGLYRKLVGGKWVLDPVSRKQCVEVAKTKLVLQAYYWDDLTLSVAEQTDWLINTVKAEGLPIKYIWMDQEQWWTDWNAWYQAKRDGNWAAVPRGDPLSISKHYHASMNTMFGEFPTKVGVYTNNGFVLSWAPDMNTWLIEYKQWVPQYGRQPDGAMLMTWAQLQAQWMPGYDIILAAGQKPDLVEGHQFTGDVCRLPGSYDQNDDAVPLDVSVFRKAFIDILRGEVDPTPAPVPVPVPTHPSICPTCGQNWPQATTGNAYVVLYPKVNVRSGPGSFCGWVRIAVKDEVVYASVPEVVQNDFIKLTDGTWIYRAYLKAA